MTGPSGFERPVVIKRILPHLMGLMDFKSMFPDEGRIAARIGHPNVVQVQELAEERDELYLVMEYLEGEAASGLARRARARQRRLDPALAAYIVAEACAGLHAAHELASPEGEPLGVIHRDVSPQNLFVGYDGRVKVLDFGIAKAAGRITSTEAGTLKGKFEYMSPEQADGRPLDRRSDVFALGVVLYELSTQRRLFKRGAPTETLRAVTRDPIVPPSLIDPGYPLALERICMKALERDVDARYASAVDMRRDLLKALHGLDAPAMPEEALSALMHELFEDRIEEKREMLSRMRDGITPSHVPTADVVDEDLPTVEAEASVVRSRTPLSEQHGSRGRARWIVGAVGLAAIALAGIGLSLRPRAEAPTAAVQRAVVPTGAASTALAAPNTVTPVAADVMIDVVSEPHARVIVDGEDRGETPITLTIARDDEEHVLRLERDGYRAREETFRADVAQRIRLSLDPVDADETPRPTSQRRRHRALAPGTPPAAPPAAPAVDDARQRAFRRFN